MDRRVKERLVGASILAVLIVLIVPALLSGPPPEPAAGSASPTLPVSAPEPIRNVTVDLATSKAPEPLAEAASASTAQLPPVRNGNAPSAGGGAGTDMGSGTGMGTGGTPVAPSLVAPSSVAPPAPLETAPAPPTSSVSAEKPAIAGHAWTVQLGSFASHENADKLLRQLRAQGFAAFMSPGGSGPSLRYRVRIGPMSDRGAAAQTVTKLKALGHPASIVAPMP
jgi:DedD protein